MSPLEAITEWRRGCPNGGEDFPVACTDCTTALIDAIEAKLRRIRIQIEVVRLLAEGGTADVLPDVAKLLGEIDL